MHTELLTITDPDAQSGDIARAGALLRAGKLVVLPTETVYGLGANALDAQAVGDIFCAKGRPADNPLIVHIADMDMLSTLCTRISDTAHALARAFWPGPLTLLLPRASVIPDIVTASLPTVGIRIPAHPVARAVIRAAGVPIAAPSSNRSGRPSPTEARHALADMDGRVAMVVDGGPCTVGVESTVVLVSDDTARILRPGGITPEEIADVLGAEHVVLDPGLFGKAADKPLSPGMKYRHYAPRAPLTAVTGTPDKSAAAIRALGLRPGCAVLCFDEYIGSFACPSVGFGPKDRPDLQASRLFSALLSLDDMDITCIYAQCPAETGMGLAVANRIQRAAGFHIIKSTGGTPT